MAELGERLRKARRERGWTLRQLEDASGVANSHLSMIENGHRNGLSLRNAARIADALNVSIDWLAGRTVWLEGSRIRNQERLLDGMAMHEHDTCSPASGTGSAQSVGGRNKGVNPHPVAHGQSCAWTITS